MPAYKPYPTVETTPSRKQRKSQRKKIYWDNKMLMNEIRRERRLARKKAKAEAEKGE